VNTHTAAPAVARGDIYFAFLDPVVGSEQGGHRPVLIVSNDTGNRHAPTVIAAPLTSRVKPALPTHLPVSSIPALRCGFASVVLLEQLRTLDRQRLGAYVGSVGNTAMCAVDAALAASLGLRRLRHPPVIMTLCAKCAQAYFDAGGYALSRTDRAQRTKERCTVCNTNMGYDYKVVRG
jgi:mRNA interferase MazF